MTGFGRAAWIGAWTLIGGWALTAQLWAQDPSSQPPGSTPPGTETPGAESPSAKPPVAKPPNSPSSTNEVAKNAQPDPAAKPAEDPAAKPNAQPSQAQSAQTDGAATSGATATPAATSAEPAPASTLPAPWEARYRTHADFVTWVTSWIDSALAERVTLPDSRGGVAVPAFQFGAPGPTPLDQRPTVFLLGGLDGASLAGCEGALRAADELLRARDSLPPTVALVCVPWAAPDGLARTLAGEPCDGRDGLAVDDDGDLALDEDGPDDGDGDGVILDMLVEDARGARTRGADARFLVRATNGDRQRYARVKEGRDDDGDGRFNEDQVGGVVLDLAFPVGWNGEPGGLGGALPLDDELTRALADLMLARPPLAVLAFQGNHGVLARTGGVDGLAWSDGSGSRADVAAVKLFTGATHREQADPIALRVARGDARPGAALD